MCSDADGWDSNLLSEVRPSDFVILLLLQDVGIMTPQTKIKKKILKLSSQGGVDQLTVSENITREEGWFEGRDTNEILVRTNIDKY